MNASKASFINAMVLILVGLWGAYSNNFEAPTAFIPVAFGVVLLALNGGVRKENKTIAHIAVVLTLLVALALFMPMMGAFKRGDDTAAFRVIFMFASSVFALFYFVRSFIAARKAREAA